MDNDFLSKLPQSGKVNPSAAKMLSLFDQMEEQFNADNFIIEQLKPDIDDTDILSPQRFRSEILCILNKIQQQKEDHLSPEEISLKQQVVAILREEEKKNNHLLQIRHSLLLG